jgi:hypothetical protein
VLFNAAAYFRVFGRNLTGATEGSGYTDAHWQQALHSMDLDAAQVGCVSNMLDPLFV